MGKPLEEKDLKRLLNEKLGRIIALDPGVTTGFATYDQHDPMSSKVWQKVCTHDEFIQELNDAWPNIIVCEKFVHTHRTGTDYTPVEFIGLTKWFCEKRGILLIEQTPAYGKSFFDNEKLKKLGVYVPAMGHAMDALRHLYQFMMKNGLFDLRLLK